MKDVIREIPDYIPMNIPSINTGCTIPSGTTGVLGVMVMPYHSEHRWSRVGAVYASDVCQFRDIYLRPTLNIVAINFVFVIELFIIVYYSHKKIISPI